MIWTVYVSIYWCIWWKTHGKINERHFRVCLLGRTMNSTSWRLMCIHCWQENWNISTEQKKSKILFSHLKENLLIFIFLKKVKFNFNRNVIEIPGQIECCVWVLILSWTKWKKSSKSKLKQKIRIQSVQFQFVTIISAILSNLECWKHYHRRLLEFLMMMMMKEYTKLSWIWIGVGCWHFVRYCWEISSYMRLQIRIYMCLLA